MKTQSRFICNHKKEKEEIPSAEYFFGDPIPTVGSVEDAKKMGYVGIYKKGDQEPLIK